MKKLNKYKIILLLALLGLLNGCEDRLDLKNITAYDPTDIWNNAETAQFYVNNCYSFVLGGGWEYLVGWYDEDSDYLLSGAVTTENSLQKVWLYGDLRRINSGLQDIETGNLTDDEKSRIKGQLYFLRAWLYTKMVFQHGGVPIIEHPQSVNEDLYVSRNSTAECFDFIVADLDMAIASQINDKSRGSVYGMIDKAAAKAFKGRVLLYKASPLFNPDNYWDNSYWQGAYAANKQAYTDLLAAGYRLLDSYSKLFADKRGVDFENDEYILPRIYKYPNTTRSERAIRPLSVSTGATGACQPIWEHILLYPMLDGKPIDQSTKYPYTLDTYFQNRDPRFYSNIYYNGGIAEVNGTLPGAGRRQYCTDDLRNLAVPYASDDYVKLAPLSNGYNRTGFFAKKGIMESNDINNLDFGDTDFPLIRFAEVMLNYAEAANETGHSNEAIEMLKLIRERAGIEPGSDGNYGMDISTRESIRTVIQNETAVELYLEGRRFPNMRRWRRLAEWDNQAKHILYARVKEEYWVDAEHTAFIPGKNPALYELLPEDFTYEVYPMITGNNIKIQTMPSTYYYFPIQLKELELNQNLKQNIGWDGGTFDPKLP